MVGPLDDDVLDDGAKEEEAGRQKAELARLQAEMDEQVTHNTQHVAPVRSCIHQVCHVSSLPVHSARTSPVGQNRRERASSRAVGASPTAGTRTPRTDGEARVSHVCATGMMIMMLN